MVTVKRPDIFAFLHTQRALNSGFDIETSCVSGCDLYVLGSSREPSVDQWLKVMPVDAALDGTHNVAHVGGATVALDGRQLLGGPNPAVRLNGWDMDPTASTTLSVRTHANTTAEFTLQTVQRTDLFSAYHTEAALNAGYQIVTPCIKNCDVYIGYVKEKRTGREWMDVMPVDAPLDNIHNVVHSGSLTVALDGRLTSAEPPPQQSISNAKWLVIATDLRWYQYIMPVFSVMGLVYLALAFVSICRKKTAWTSVAIPLSLLATMMCRVAFLSTVSVVSFTDATVSRYIGPAYTLLVMFLAVSIAGSAELMRNWARRGG